MADSDSNPLITSEKPRAKRLRGRHGLGYLYQHHSCWWVDVKLEGHCHRLKLGLVKLFEKREARQLADAKIKELCMPKPPEPAPQPGTVAFSVFAAKFAAWAVETKLGWARYRDKPLEQTPLRVAVSFFGDTPLKDISKDRIKDFELHVARRTIAGRPVKNRTVNAYVKDLRHLFNKAMEWDDEGTNPVARFKFAKEGRQISAGRVLETDEEQAKLLAALPAWLRLMTELGLQTGARRGDLVKLTWRSVHLDHVEFLETKECKHREVSLSSCARAILALLRPPGASLNTFVFEPDVLRKTLISRMRREWARALKTSGVAKLRFHDLRHTVGTRLVRGAVDLRTVQGIMGHASLKTTERYLHSNDRLRQAAVETLAQFSGSVSTTTTNGQDGKTALSGNTIN